ncbi:hypothetical protein FSP39_019703 [Pinctada imbricata]|uniref:Tyrosinase copper-binding domain-containing protein n=1 Tax=Pinctada imbricata TaxID=66713 RepID=A0AA88YFQ4_PINIB|nr:hypothetical protein FSP39_019703 [Pinctada imbricata]
MFTDELVGNGMGQVINGPFRDWFVPRMNGMLRRNIGRRASLVRPWIADQIMYSQNISSHNQIVTVGGNRVSIEGEHNGVHVWVGEVMMDILSAPQDGVFWLHHTYVDYLWERFRQKLVRLGRNPEIDYPDPTNGQHPGHNGSDPMPIFYSQYHYIWTNQRGYSNLLLNFYEYADHPTCGNGCGGNTKFLYCPNNNTNNASTRCVSRTAERDTVPEEALGQFGGRNLSEFDFKNGTATSSINNTNSLGEMAAALEGPLSKSAWQFTSKLKDNRLN